MTTNEDRVFTMTERAAAMDDAKTFAEAIDEAIDEAHANGKSTHIVELTNTVKIATGLILYYRGLVLSAIAAGAAPGTLPDVRALVELHMTAACAAGFKPCASHAAAALKPKACA